MRSPRDACGGVPIAATVAAWLATAMFVESFAVVKIVCIRTRSLDAVEASLVGQGWVRGGGDARAEGV